MKMNKFHEVEIKQIDPDFLYLVVDSHLYRIRWSECSERLAQADREQRKQIEISPSGYGLHWPLIDEDLAVDPLLQHAEMLETLNA